MRQSINVNGMKLKAESDKNGVLRFIKDPIVDYMCRNNKIDFNQMAIDVQTGKLEPNTWLKIVATSGYSVSGFMDVVYSAVHLWHVDFKIKVRKGKLYQ